MVPVLVRRPRHDDARDREQSRRRQGVKPGLRDHEEARVRQGGEREVVRSVERRLGVREEPILIMQSNLANTYERVGRFEEASRMRRETYSRTLKLLGDESRETLEEANNYANCLFYLKRFQEAKTLLRKTIPVAQRVLGASNEFTFKMRGCHARALCSDPSSTLSELREGVTKFEDLERDARRVLGGTHPLVLDIQHILRDARVTLRARETLSGAI